MEIRELLNEYEFPGDDTPIITGSALKALEGDTSDIGVPAVQKLVEELDVSIPEPARDTDKPFLMPVEDVFTISGRGTVVTGRIETGIVKTGDALEIVGINDTTETTCTGVEMFRKSLDEGRAGENCGVLLRGIDRDASLSIPLRRTPQFSPALPSSRDFLNISTPVHVVSVVSLIPTISRASPVLTIPVSILPVTTVPLPEIVKTSSTGIKKGLSVSLAGSGIETSSSSTNF